MLRVLSASGSALTAIILEAHSSVNSPSRKCRSHRTQVIPSINGRRRSHCNFASEGRNESASLDVYLTPDRYRGVHTGSTYATVCTQAR